MINQNNINELIRIKCQRPVNFKSFSGEEMTIKGNKVTGYLAAFGNRDEEGDVIMKGAFAKSIQEHGPQSSSPRKIIYLYSHNPELPLGRFEILREDDYGLYFEADMDPIDLVEQVKIQYATGTLNQHSIGFRYIWDKIDYDQVTETFYLKEVKLFEGSVVSMGANENTPFLGFKGSQILDARTELSESFESMITLVGKTHPNESYEMRKIMSKYIALFENQTDKKSLIINEPAKRIDLNKLTSLITKQSQS